MFLFIKSSTSNIHFNYYFKCIFKFQRNALIVSFIANKVCISSGTVILSF